MTEILEPYAVVETVFADEALASLQIFYCAFIGPTLISEFIFIFWLVWRIWFL